MYAIKTESLKRAFKDKLAGCAGLANLVPNAGVFLHVLIATVVWTAAALVGSNFVLKKKDLKS